MTSIVSVILWLVQNPQIVAQGEKFVADAVQTAVNAWNRFQSGELTTEQLQAERTAAGVDLEAVEDAATASGL